MSAFAVETEKNYPSGTVNAGKHKAYHAILEYHGGYLIPIARDTSYFSVAAGGSASWSLDKISGAGKTMPAVSGTVKGEGVLKYCADVYSDTVIKIAEGIIPLLKKIF